MFVLCLLLVLCRVSVLLAPTGEASAKQVISLQHLDIDLAGASSSVPSVHASCPSSSPASSSTTAPISCTGSDPSQGNPAAFDKVTGLAQTAATLPASAEQTDSQVHRGREGRGDYKEYPECTSVPQAEHQPPLAPLHHSPPSSISSASVSVSSTVSTSAFVQVSSCSQGPSSPGPTIPGRAHYANMKFDGAWICICGETECPYMEIGYSQRRKCGSLARTCLLVDHQARPRLREATQVVGWRKR